MTPTGTDDLRDRTADARDALEEVLESPELAAGVEGVPLDEERWKRLGEKVERAQEPVGVALDLLLEERLSE